MRDLIEKLNQLQRDEETLSEAPVHPGERKGISFKLKKLEKLSNELDKYKSSLHSMKYMELPPALKTEMKQIEDKLNAEIDKVSQAYQVEYEKSKANDRPVKMDNLFKALAKHCTQIIKVYKELNRNDFSREKFLFRGIRSSDDALYGRPFESRKPKDSNRELHELVNNAINNLGFDANRENSMFVTGDRGQASGYGHSLYIMFPVDGFTFTWSKTVKDLVLDNSKKLEMLNKDVIAKIRAIVKQARDADPTNFPISYPDDLFTTGYDYENDRERLIRAVEAGKLPDEIEDLLDDILTDQSIQAHFQFTDQDLFSAILSEKEIYVKGNYYAINMNHRDELFKFLGEINTDDVELPESFGEVPQILDKGDVVRVLSGPYEGKLGTITYSYSDSYDVFINPKVGDPTLKKDQVELYTLPDGSLPLFEKGDEVIVIDPESRLYGSVVTLHFVYTNGKTEFVDKAGNYHTAYKNQLEQYSLEREQEILKDIETRPPTINVDDLVVVSDPDSEFFKQRGKVNYIYSTGKIEVRLLKNHDYIDFQPNQLVLLDNAPPELVQAEEGQFNLGDKVQITAGEWQGYYGKIEYLYSNSKKAEVDLAGMDTKVDVWLKDLQHSGTEKAGPKFAVGDKVKITVGDYSGEEATVNYISTFYPDEIDVKMDKDGSLKTIPTTGLELITDTKNEAKTFKIGDRVKVIDGSDDDYDQTGTVTWVDDQAIMVDIDPGTVAAEEDMEKEFQPSQLEIISSPSAQSQSTSNQIKVGDIIEVTNHESSYYGVTGVVIEIGQNESGKKWIKFKNDVLHGGVKTFIDWVEKVSSPEKSVETFKPGDKFKIKDKSYSVDGSIATVLDGPDSDGDYKAVTDDGKIVFTAIHQMEKIDSAISLNIGDNVKIIDKSSGFYGDIGEIESGPDADGDYVVRFRDGDWSYYQLDAMEKVEKPSNQSTSDEIDNLTWTPEPEVAAPVKSIKVGDTVIAKGPSAYNVDAYNGKQGEITSVSDDGKFAGVMFGPDNILTYDTSNLEKVNTTAPTLDIGDKVEVVSQFPSLIGKTGTILQTNPKYGFVSLQLDGNTEPSSFPVSALKKIEQQEDNSIPSSLGDLKIGDTVEVVNNKLSSFGKQGKIIDINPVNLFLDFDGDGTPEAAVKPASVKKIG